MTQAADLVYPIRLNSQLMYRYLQGIKVGDPRGPLVVEIIATLSRCEQLARSLYTPSVEGL